MTVKANESAGREKERENMKRKGDSYQKIIKRSLNKWHTLAGSLTEMFQ